MIRIHLYQLHTFCSFAICILLVLVGSETVLHHTSLTETMTARAIQEHQVENDPLQSPDIISHENDPKSSDQDIAYKREMVVESLPTNIDIDENLLSEKRDEIVLPQEVLAFARFIQPHTIMLDIKDINETIDNKRIIAQYIQLRSGKRTIELDLDFLDSSRLIDTIYHEFGHFLWYEIISETDKEMWYNLTRRYPQTLNDYAQTSIEEEWAEFFTVFYEDKDPFLTNRYCPVIWTAQTEEDIIKKRDFLSHILEPLHIDVLSFDSYKTRCSTS